MCLNVSKKWSKFFKNLNINSVIDLIAGVKLDTVWLSSLELRHDTDVTWLPLMCFLSLQLGRAVNQSHFIHSHTGVANGAWAAFSASTVSARERFTVWYNISLFCPHATRGHEPGSRLRPPRRTFLTLRAARSTAVFITFAPQSYGGKPQGDDSRAQGVKPGECDDGRGRLHVCARLELRTEKTADVWGKILTHTQGSFFLRMKGMRWYFMYNM